MVIGQVNKFESVLIYNFIFGILRNAGFIFKQIQKKTLETNMSYF